MLPRPKKQVQQGLDEVKNELRGPNQDSIQQLVKLVVKAYEEGIDEGRKSLTRNWMTEVEVNSMKEVQIGKESNNNRRDFKRKWGNNRDEPEVSQLKKVKAYACINCGKKHIGVCLKGKGVCYHCKQKGHMTPQCPKRRKGGCFECGAHDHQVKMCSNKKEKK